jgi:hypothetical protein
MEQSEGLDDEDRKEGAEILRLLDAVGDMKQ